MSGTENRMVDISAKPETKRIAVALGKVFMKKETLKRVLAAKLPKGDALSTARIAGIMAAKKTPELIPMCHPLEITKVEVDFKSNLKEVSLSVSATVSVIGRTGVEMEALTAVSVACLTVYDMCKAIDKDIIISDIKLIKKSGGRSGIYERK